MADTGKILFEAVSARLAAQKDNQAALVSRAKDLLGLTSIAGTTLSLLANDKLFNITKTKPPAWWLVLSGCAIALTIFAGILALLPRKWSFATDPADLKARIDDVANGSATMDDWYRAIAVGYLEAGPRKSGLLLARQEPMTQLQFNAEQMEILARLVAAQAVGLVALAALAFALIFIL